MASKNAKVSSGNSKKEKNPIVSSTTCENCKDKCENYFKYEAKLKSGKISKGIFCKKVNL